MARTVVYLVFPILVSLLVEKKEYFHPVTLNFDPDL